MTWEEVKLFFKFFIGGVGVLTTVAGFWITFDLPQAASRDYVDKKFILASETSKQVQLTVNHTRLQINRMTRQGLEAEKYRLTEEAKTNNSFTIQKRLRDIEADLQDTARERETLIKLIQ